MKKLKYVTLITATLFLAACDKTPVYKVQLNENTESHCANISPYGLPVTNNQTNSFYCLTGFALEYNKPIASSMWVSERISYDHLKENLKQEVREDDYRNIPFLSDNQQISLNALQSREEYRGFKFAATKNYRAKIDDFHHQKVMSQTFYIPNIGLIHKNNRKLTDNIERHIRLWSLMKKVDLVIHTGPLFLINKGDKLDIIKSGGLEYKIPTHFYKIVISPKTKESIAFVIPNRDLNNETNFNQFIVPISFISSKNYIDFLPKIKDKGLKERYLNSRNNGDWRQYPYNALVEKDY